MEENSHVTLLKACVMVSLAYFTIFNCVSLYLSDTCVPGVPESRKLAKWTISTIMLKEISIEFSLSSLRSTVIQIATYSSLCEVAVGLRFLCSSTDPLDPKLGWYTQ